MGREANVAKTRQCRHCFTKFLGMTAIQIEIHGLVCEFENRTGIEVIRMGEIEEGNEPLIVAP